MARAVAERTASEGGRGWRARRIRFRVGLGVAVTVIIMAAIGMVTWATYLNTRASLIELAHERVRELLRSAATGMENHLLLAVPAIELSRMLVRDTVVPSDPDALARQFTLTLRANPSFAWVSYSDEAGTFTGAYRTLAGALRVSQSSIRAGQGELREYTVNEDGSWTPHSRQHQYGYDPRAERFYRAARDARRRVWVGPYVFYDEGVPGITCALPHLAPDGRLLGVFTVDFKLSFLSQFVSELRFGDHGRVFVLTPDETVVAHPTVRLVETSGQGSAGKLITIADVDDPVLQAFVATLRSQATREAAPATVTTVPRPAGAPETLGTLGVLRSDGAELIFEHGGEGYLGGYQMIEIGRELTWVLGAYAPERDFLEALAWNQLAALIVAAVALAAGVLVALVLARRISVPLTDLAAEMEEVGSFRLTARPPRQTIFREVALMDAALLGMKRSLRSFAYYVPTDLVRALLTSGQEAKLQGETRELTVYFSDIADFTSIAERMTPDGLVQHLSGYFDEMTRILLGHGGTVDKFIGDAIMAFWGAPAESDDHAARACEAAIRCQRSLADHRAAGAPWAATLHARIGVASGEVVVGNIGSAERFNYTVMGDTVNVASRLEGLNKVYATAILVSEATYRAARERVVARPVDIVRVKGKQQGVRVYELLCLTADSDDEARRVAALAELGLDAYLARDFAQAARHFEEILRLRPQDGPGTLLLERARHFRVAPPPADWDGVYVATEK